MAAAASVPRLELLERLGQRHDALLAELDALNSRIEAALAECSAQRSGEETAGAA